MRSALQTKSPAIPQPIDAPDNLLVIKSIASEESEFEEKKLFKSVTKYGQIEVGTQVRHTRFLNTNGPAGTFVLEISESKALCQYLDHQGKNRQVWFLLDDLIKAK